MPRKPRPKSISKVYHCMIRGINKQDIFFDNQDYSKFEKILRESKEKFHYKLYSYVLMPNHIHLQIKDESQNLFKIMQSIQISYSNYFNKKYERVGHLFQERYKSNPVETQEYVLNLIRYIHQNPEKAGIEATDKYKWSSYRFYLEDNDIIDTEDILILLDGESMEEKKNNFIELNKKVVKLKNSEQLLKYEMKKSLSDNELIYFIQEKLKIKNIQKIQFYPKEKRDEILKKLVKMQGTTKVQISRVLGISKRIVERNTR